MHAARLGHRSTADRPGARPASARIERLGPPLALGLTALVRDAVDLDAARTDLLATVTRAVEPAHASVWIRGGNQ